MNNQTLINENKYEVCFTKRFSWGAVFAGALVGIGLGFLLNVFGLAIGLSAFTTNPDGMTTLAIGGFIGMLIGTIVTMFFSGWVAGYLARLHCYHHCVGALYGFVAWSLALVFTIGLTVHTGNFLTHNLQYITKDNVAIVTASMDRDAPFMTHQSDENSNLSVTKVNAEDATNALGEVTFITFILFFVGALSSTIGGYCALKCKKDTCYDEHKMELPKV